LVKIVVREYRPLRTVLVSVLIVVAAAAGGWSLWQRERGALQLQLDESTRRAAELASENRALKAGNDALNRKLSRVERAAQIESEAYAKVNSDLAALQEELQAVKEEVSFYQGVSADNGNEKVRVQRFAVEPIDEGGSHVLRLVLARVLKDDSVFRGTVELAFDGELNEKAVRLEHADVLVEAGAAIAFGFRHFSRIERKLRLPEGFVPKTVVVIIRADGKKDVELEESFAWPT
jgi:hypothetical protein